MDGIATDRPQRARGQAETRAGLRLGSQGQGGASTPGSKSSDRKGAPGSSGDAPVDETCFFCGSLPEGAVLVRGVFGSICSSCVFALSARLAEAEREQVDPSNASPEENASDLLLGDDTELPAQEYESAADLAAAYVELGRKASAIEQYFQALEGALTCADWAFGLTIVAKLREFADGPTVRDRIHDVLGRHVPDTKKGEDTNTGVTGDG